MRTNYVLSKMHLPCRLYTATHTIVFQKLLGICRERLSFDVGNGKVLAPQNCLPH